MNRINKKMARFRLITGLILQWQIIILLILPFSFYTKIDTIYGKYFNTSTSTVAVSSINRRELHLHANLDSGRLYVYIDNKLAEYLFVSGGQDTSQTPLGTFPLHVNAREYYAMIPNGKFFIRCTKGTSFEEMPTGIKNFSDGDLYLSPHDFSLLNALFRSPYSNATLTVSCSSYPWQTIGLGTLSQDVFIVQCSLKEKGIFHSKPNGYFDEQTKTAVITFQHRSGLFATGAVNAATYFKLTHPTSNPLLR